jgi:hypothetical protein
MEENQGQSEVKNWLRAVKHSPHLLGRLLGFKELLPLHGGWIKECWDTNGSHGLMAFRGSYKTSSVVTTGIIRYLLFRPNSRILVIRKTHTEACQVVKAISRAFEQEPLHALFAMAHGIPPEKLTDANDRILFNFKQNTTLEPSIRAFGIGTSITGAHADVIIADDIIGLQDRVSRAERERVKENIRELAANIIDPGALTIWLGTKWAQGDGWDVIESFTEVKKYPESKYNTFIPKEEIEIKRRTLTPFLYAINYELELIADESLLFKEPCWGVFDTETWRTQKVYAHIDAAYGGEDDCALTIMAGHHAIGWAHHGNVHNWYDFIKMKYQQYHCSMILSETNADKGFLARDLRGIGLTTRAYNENTNKAIKISTYLYEAWPDLIWDDETDPDYMNQILDWRQDDKGHDDAPDSASCLVRFFKEQKTGVLDDEALAFFHGRG